MVDQLTEIIKKVEQLSEAEQLSIAKMLKEELQWKDTLANTGSELETLAKEAIEEYKTGKTSDKD